MAVTITADQLGEAIKAKGKEVQRLLMVCTELVNGYAPTAPEHVCNEAVIRCAGWLKQSAIRLGDLRTETRSTAIHPLRASGARAMLAPWHPHVPEIGS